MFFQCYLVLRRKYSMLEWSRMLYLKGMDIICKNVGRMERESMKLMIIVSSKEEGRKLSDYLSRKQDIEIIDILYHGGDAYEQIIKKQPDMILINMILPGMDGLELMEQLAADLNMPKLPKVIVLSAVDNLTIMECACQAGVDFYMLKPYRLETLYNRMLQLQKEKQKQAVSREMVRMETDSPISGRIYSDNSMEDANENQLELEITEVLRRIGMPAHIKGYQYIRTGIMMAVQDITILNYITKLLYPSIAKQYNTTPSSVERAIRHAIEVAWNRGDMAALQEVFGFSISPERGKPTNSEFIAQLADQYRVDYNIRKRA